MALAKRARVTWAWLYSWKLTCENNLFRWLLRRKALPHWLLIEWNASLNIRTIRMWDGSYRDLSAAKGNAIVEKLLAKGNAAVDKLRKSEQQRQEE